MKHWPAKQAAKIEQLVARHANNREYAVFDADNTIWYKDLEESLLASLENKNILTRKTMDPGLVPVPFHSDDTLVSYGYKLNDIDHKIGYPWFARIFSGLTLDQLKKYVDELFALKGEKIPCRYWENNKLVDGLLESPRIFPAQKELINELQENGVEVFVITAALEELARMILSDPDYGVNIKPENVIGVSCLLKNKKTQKLTTARNQIACGHFWDAKFTKKDHYDMEVTSWVQSPDTFYSGKLAALKEYIHPIKQPVLVAGDSQSDHFLLSCCDNRKGGLKIWINRKEQEWVRTQKAYRKYAEQEKKLNLEATGDKNWIMVYPEDIGVES